MKTSSRFGLVCLALIATAGTAASSAHAELSDKSKGIVWNVEKFIYMGSCRFDKPMPDVDLDFVGECERSYEEEGKYLNALSAEEKKDTRVKAAFEMHKKSADFIQKAKAAQKAKSERVESLNAGKKAFHDDTEANKDGLWFLRQLDQKQDSYIDGYIGQDVIEKKVDVALSLKDFAGRCASTYEKAGGWRGSEEFLEGPKGTCPYARDREAILKREMPRVFERMRGGNADASKLAIAKIKSGQLVTANDVACAKDPGACGSAGEQIKRIATKLGISVGASGGGDKTAFDAAMQAATSQRRIGTFHDASREGVAAGALKRAGVSYSAMALYKAADDVKKNDLGVPVWRERAAGVLVKSGSDTFCRAYMVVVYADYEGGGRYGALRADAFSPDKDRFVVSGCK